MQAIMEKSVAKGQFAHKGTVRAPPDPSIDGDDEKGDDSAIGHAVALSLATMISPAPQVHDGSTPMDLDDPAVLSTSSHPLSPPDQLLQTASPSLPILSVSTMTTSTLPAASASSNPPASASAPSVRSAKSKSSQKRKRASEDGHIPDQPTSKSASKARSTSGTTSTKTNTSISALVGATGAINNLNTTMQQSLSQSDARRIEQAMELIKDVEYIDDNEKGALSFYYSNNPNAAGSLVAMSDMQRKNTLRYALQMILQPATS